MITLTPAVVNFGQILVGKKSTRVLRVTSSPPSNHAWLEIEWDNYLPGLKAEYDSDDGKITLSVDSSILVVGKHNAVLYVKTEEQTLKVSVFVEIYKIVTNLQFSKPTIVLPTVNFEESTSTTFKATMSGMAPTVFDAKLARGNPNFRVSYKPTDPNTFPKTISVTMETGFGKYNIPTGDFKDTLTITLDSVKYDIPVTVKVLPERPLSVGMPSSIDCGAIRLGGKTSKSFTIKETGRPIHEINLNWEGVIPFWSGPLEYTTSNSYSPYPLTITFPIHAKKVGDYYASIQVDLYDKRRRHARISVPVHLKVKPWLSR